jgi:hypothetical protein
VKRQEVFRLAGLSHVIRNSLGNMLMGTSCVGSYDDSTASVRVCLSAQICTVCVSVRVCVGVCVCYKELCLRVKMYSVCVCVCVCATNCLIRFT